MRATFAFILTFSILAGCQREGARSMSTRDSIRAQAPSPSTPPPDTLGLLTGAEMRINSVGLDMTHREVERLLGQPKHKVGPYKTEVTDEPVTKWQYASLEVEFFGDKVTYVTCRTGPCETPAGLRLGDGRDKVERLYGAGSRIQGDSALLYVHRSSDCGMTFEFTSTRVSGMLLWCDYS